MRKLVFLATLFLLSCSEQDSIQSDYNSFSSLYKPTLYAFEYNGKTSYLFGTIHSGSSDMYPLPKYVDNAIKKSDAFVYEIDITDTDTEQYDNAYSELMNTDDKPLRSFLSDRTLKAVMTQCVDENSICESELHQEPWFSAFIFASKKNTNSDLKPLYGVEVALMTKLGDRPLYALENTLQQIYYMDSIPFEVQDLMVFSALVDHPSSLVQSWKLGEISRYMEQEQKILLKEGLSEEQVQQLRKYTLYERNEAMTQKLMEHLNKNQSLFVAVGAAHLFGPNSIVDHLENKSIHVKEITGMY